MNNSPAVTDDQENIKIGATDRLELKEAAYERMYQGCNQ